MSILLTSFAPWLSHHTENSSDELLAAIQNNYIDFLFLRQLPVDIHRASERVIKVIQYQKPDLVICCGMAANRYRLSLESNARNTTDKLLTTIPLGDLVKNLDYTYISNNAGQFVCEGLYFQVLKHHPRALFVHVPLLNDNNFPFIQKDVKEITTIVRQYSAIS